MTVNQILLNELTTWYRKQSEKPDIRSVDAKIPLLVALHDLGGLSETDHKDTFEQFLEDHEVTWGLGDGVTAKDFTPWLENWKAIKGNSLTRWERYSQYLAEKGWPYAATEGLDGVTDKLLDLVGSPNRPGEWERKGLAIGEVQSGKTANYIGLLNKALDTGYEILIVLGGHTNDLREQTQIRIDTDLIGFDSSYSNESVVDSERVRKSSVTGVGLIADNERFRQLRRPSSLTTRESDFSTANRASQGLSIGNGPVIAVVKKHAQTIERLARFLRAQSTNGRLDAPLLVIDDESDWASVNTGDEEDIKAVNGAIRSLLDSSRRASYLAVTATPFANILIDDSNSGDLFPRDYVRALPSPSNYLGVNQYMIPEARKTNPNRLQTDVEDALEEIPYAHKKHHRIDQLPESMKEAIRAFVIGTAVRYLREAGPVHASMMINVSHLNEVQENVHAHVAEYVGTVSSALLRTESRDAYAMLNDLRATCNNAYPRLEISFEEIKSHLTAVAKGVHTELINSKTSAQRKKSLSRMTKKARNEYALRPVVYVGGNVLSRGLTLEGLQVSFFLRRTGAADTLLQMGRWFGYRSRYDDLVRVWIDPDIVELFEYSAVISEELREELAQMQALELTPKDFGLKIRMHPESFRITAANKQKNATTVTGEVDVFGHVFESAFLPNGGEAGKRNARAANNLVSTLLKEYGDRRETKGKGETWRDIPSGEVEQFFTTFAADPRDTFLGARSGGGSKMLAALGAPGMPLEWDIRFVSGNASTEFPFKLPPPDAFSVKMSERNKMVEVTDGRHRYIELGNRRLATGGDVLNSMPGAERERADRAFSKVKSVPGYNGPKIMGQDFAVRNGLKKPLLLIYKITANQEKAEKENNYFPEVPLTGAVVAFPGAGESRRRGVQFRANTVYVRESLGRRYETDTDESGASDE